MNKTVWSVSVDAQRLLCGHKINNKLWIVLLWSRKQTFPSTACPAVVCVDTESEVWCTQAVQTFWVHEGAVVNWEAEAETCEPNRLRDVKGLGGDNHSRVQEVSSTILLLRCNAMQASPCVLPPLFLSFSNMNAHTHTHTHTHIWRSKRPSSVRAPCCIGNSI